MNSVNSPVPGWLAAQRAVRHFTDESVPAEVVDDILGVARWTGSARNRQPWRFVVVTAPGTRRRLSELGQYAQHLAAAPLVIAVLADPASGGADTEFDIGRACQNIATAASARGLGSCPATLYPAANTHAAARLFGFDAPWECRHALSLGYPARLPAGRSAIPTGRRPIQQLVLKVD